MHRPAGAQDMELKTKDARGLLSLFDVRLCGIGGINEQKQR
jgi:hypothetical protein